MKLHIILGWVLRPVRLTVFYTLNALLRTPRARVLLWNENDEVLLVRNWAGHRQWILPGGGVKRNERPIDAARRELHEELGTKLPVKDLVYVATLRQAYEAWLYTATVPKDSISLTPNNPWEITDLQWFSPKKMPVDVSPLVLAALKNLSKSE